MRVNAINDHHRSAIFLSFLSSYHSSEPHTKIDRLFERFWLVFVCVCVRFSSNGMRKLSDGKCNRGLRVFFSRSPSLFLLRVKCSWSKRPRKRKSLMRTIVSYHRSFRKSSARNRSIFSPMILDYF